MKDLLFGESNCLGDIEAILIAEFHEQPYVKQPRIVAHLAAVDGILLRHAFEFIQRETNRGNRLADYPLHLLAFVVDEAARAQVEADLIGLPFQVLMIRDVSVEAVLEALGEHGIAELASVLYFQGLEDTSQMIPFEEWRRLSGPHGFVILQSCSPAEEQLRTAAEAGCFAEMGHSRCYPREAAQARASLNYFRVRKQRVRFAVADDIAQMRAIEQSCLAAPLIPPEAVIRERLARFPEGQLLLIGEQGVIGVAYSQRIASADLLDGVDELLVDRLGQPESPLVQLIGLYVAPTRNHLELEQQFLEYFLQFALASPGVLGVAAVVRCQNYPGPDVISMVSYVEELKVEQGSADPAVRLHVQHGAEIIKCLSGYRPLDTANQGSGVLVTYRRGQRGARAGAVRADERQESEIEYTEESIGVMVDQLLRRCVPSGQYRRTETWTGMGIKSVLLLELRSQLCSEFRLDLASNFFAQHETAEAVIAYLVKSKVHAYKEWLYETFWEGVPKLEPRPLVAGGRWIIVGNEHAIADQLRARLLEQKQECVQVTLKEGEVTECFRAGPVAGVILLVGNGRQLEATLEQLEEAHESNLWTLTRVATEVALASGSEVRLWVVTEGTLQDASFKTLTEWPVTCLCKVIREEYPKLGVTQVAIDMDLGITEACEDLVQEIAGQSNEPIVVFRRGQRLVPRYRTVGVHGVRVPSLSPRATYMIVGGFRPLALLLARWYVSHGARHLVLIDELEVFQEVKITADELRQLGSQVHVKQLRLDDPTAMRAVVEETQRNGPPIKGVLHATSIVDNDLLLRMRWERFKAVHRLKVSSAWIIHALTEGLDLDHFVCFSSALPDISPLAKANHATGNGFLDALAYYRRRRGLPALSVQWGPWDLKHVQVNRVDALSVSSRIEMLPIQDGLRLLEQLFYWAHPVVAAANINWAVAFQQMADMQPLFSGIAADLGYKGSRVLESAEQRMPLSEESLVHLLKLVREGILPPDGELVVIKRPS